jgi:hypothetical protein
LITKFSVTAGSWPNWTKICDQFRLSVSGCAGNFWRINEQKKPCLEGTAGLSPGFQPWEHAQAKISSSKTPDEI